MQSVVTRVERLLKDTSLRVMAGAVAALIALVWAAGVVQYIDSSLPGAWRFALDGERLVPAAVSALLLLLLAGVAAVVAAAERQRSRGWLAFAVLAALFVFMSADEWFGVHEELESSVGEDWQLLYLGVFVVAGVAWAAALRGLDATSRALWIGGAAAWGVSQVIERIQWDGDELLYEWTILPEELLEMAGTAMWLFALVLVLRRAQAPGLATMSTMTSTSTASSSRV